MKKLLVFILIVLVLAEEKRENHDIPQKDYLSVNLDRIDEYMNFVNYMII